MAPPRTLRATARRRYKVSGLADRVRPAFTDCLGPCREANVVLLSLRGQPLWFRRIDAPELFEALLRYARGVVDGSAPTLPADLGARSFTWTGGGLRPEPPITDAEPGADVA